MSAPRILITGQIYGDPQARTSKSGSQFATAKVKADGKDGAVLWISIVAFNEVAERLLALKANNAVALSGKLEVSAYTAKDGSPAAGLSVVCDELAALKAKPRPRPVVAPAPVAAGFNDDLPDWS
ncbi:MAG: single-stranded DNA-binding protein [Candidatus Contendobacter sp.]|nr:single-stranded DNA-binding protein [Candidatus Contendobacter sp.]